MRHKRRSQSRKRAARRLQAAVLMLALVGAGGYGVYSYLSHLHQTATAVPAASEQEPIASLPAPEPKVPILMYHSIAPGYDLHVAPEEFADQMKWLDDHGYQPLTMHQLDLYWQGKYPLQGKPVVITFDDGYLDNYTAAFPVLQQHGFPATVYAITRSIGKLSNHMDWNEMREMHQKGIEFGSHTVFHPNFHEIPDSTISWELQESKRVLEVGLGSTVSTFCYPGGSVTPETPRMVREAGYWTAVTTGEGKADIGENRLLLSRVRVLGGMTIEQFAALMQS